MRRPLSVTPAEYLDLLKISMRACEAIMANPRYQDEVRERARKTHAKFAEAAAAMRGQSA